MEEYTNIIKLTRALSPYYSANLSSYEKSLVVIDMAEVYNSIGLLKLYLNDSKQAVEMFNIALKMNPKSARIQSDIASAYYKTGNYNAALAHAKLAADYENSEPQHIRNLILIYEKLGEKNQIALLEKRLKILNNDQKKLK